MNTFDTALPVTITAGDDAFGSELVVTAEPAPAEPDIGLRSAGHIIHDMRLEVTPELLRTLYRYLEQSFRLRVDGHGSVLIGFSLEDLTIENGYLPLESDALATEVDACLAERPDDYGSMMPDPVLTACRLSSGTPWIVK